MCSSELGEESGEGRRGRGDEEAGEKHRKEGLTIEEETREREREDRGGGRLCICWVICEL